MPDFTPDFQAMVRSREVDNAGDIQQAVQGRRLISRVITTDLTTAKTQYDPVRLDFPFRGFWVQDATDNNVSVSLVLNPITEGTLNAPLTIVKNVSMKLDYPVAGGYLYFTAQSGKSITIFFFTDGDVKPGSLISAITGGVSVVDGSALSSALLSTTGAAASVSVTSGAAVKILASSGTRKSALLYTDQAIWIGDASVAVGTRGVPYPAGSYITVKNTTDVYAIAVGTTATVTGNVES